MADHTKIQVLGPATLALDSVDVGYISKPMLEIKTSEVEGKSDAYGDTPLDIFHKATSMDLVVVMDEISFTNYQKAIQASTRSTSGTDEALTFGKFSGVKMTSMLLDLVPRNSAIATTHSLKLWRVVPVGDRKVDFGVDGQQAMEVRFRALIDESKTDGEKLGRFGNVSVSADTTAPTVASSSPADDATGVSASVAPTITFSEMLDPASVNSGSVALIPTGTTGTQAPVAATISLSASQLVVTITPASALTAAAEYNVILTSGIKNASGIAFAGQKRSFTVAP